MGSSAGDSGSHDELQCHDVACLRLCAKQQMRPFDQRMFYSIHTVMGAGSVNGLYKDYFDWPMCFCLASIVSATDPVAVRLHLTRP